MSAAKIPPSYGGNWADEPGKPLHNFSFTSEVRYWFSYIAENSYTLEFTGDDDVWVFVNRKLAVDMGGIHTPVNGRSVLNATGGGTVTVTPTEGDGCTRVGERDDVHGGDQDGEPRACRTMASTRSSSSRPSGRRRRRPTSSP